MRRLLAAGLATLALAGCGASAYERQACYADAEAKFVAVAYASCQARGFAWATCPDRPTLLDELKATEARCP